MRIQISHDTRYEYAAPVRLGPHLLRLRPRLDGAARELAYALAVRPLPVARAELLDAAGNRITRLWFDGTTTGFEIQVRLSVDTGPEAVRRPPEVAAAALPVRYVPAEAALLAPYLTAPEPAPAVAALAARLLAAAGDLPAFLDGLNRHLYQHIVREIRPTGAPRSPAETLARGRGACRDQGVLFIAVCRTAGIAARFVSGYQDRSALETARRHLHAWPEVYIPGAGWAGFDPTRGIATGSGHIALAAAAEPAGTMPVEGAYWGEAEARLSFDLRIDVLPDADTSHATAARD